MEIGINFNEIKGNDSLTTQGEREFQENVTKFENMTKVKIIMKVKLKDTYETPLPFKQDLKI